VIGTPIDLRRILRLEKPAVRVRYDLAEQAPGGLEAEVKQALALAVAEEALVPA